MGNAAEQIQWGKQDIMIAGGGEELDWTLSVLFDAMGALSSQRPTSVVATPMVLASIVRGSLPCCAR